MKQHPLFLKLKGSCESSCFELCSDNTISFEDSKHEFSSIFQNQLPAEALNLLTKASATLILLGPTGSGKSESLLEVLRHFASSDGNASVSACEVNKSSSFVDLLDVSASKKYLSSIPIDNQLKRVSLDNRIIQKLQKDRVVTSTTPRSCWLVNIFRDSKVLTVVNMMGTENVDSEPTSLVTGSVISNVPHHPVLSTKSSRSQNLMTNLILRRVSSANISFIMHLDKNGDMSAIRSALSGLAQVVSTFCAGQTRLGRSFLSAPLSGTVPSYARPTVASASPHKQLSSYRVGKPIKRRLASLMEKPGSRTGLSHSHRVLASKGSRLVSPVHSSDEWSKLLETVTMLQKQLATNKSIYANTIAELRAQLHETKDQSLAIIKDDISKAHHGLEIVSDEFARQKETTEDLRNEVSQLRSEKHACDSQLSEARQLIENKDAELAAVKNASAQEKRSLVMAFESEVNQMREKFASLENKNNDLTQSRNQIEVEKIKLLEETKQSTQEIGSLRSKLKSASDANVTLKQEATTAREKSLLNEKILDKLHAEISERDIQIEKIQENVSSEHSVLSQKIEDLEQQLQEKLEHIETLTDHMDVKTREIQKREQDIHEQMDVQVSKSKEEMNQLLNTVGEITAKYEAMEATKKLQENEISKLKSSLGQKEIALSEIPMLLEKCAQLEAIIQDLSEKAKERDIEHEKQVSGLNEQLEKTRGHFSSPKKFIEYTDVEPNHGNNTFSSIDVFDDQTEYMNFFKRPVLGRSPIPSPTRALTESNVRGKIVPKLSKIANHVSMALDSTPVEEQENINIT